MKKCVFGMVFFIGVLLLGISCSKSLSHSDREKQEEISALEEWNDQIVIGFPSSEQNQPFEVQIQFL